MTPEIRKSYLPVGVAVVLQHAQTRRWPNPKREYMLIQRARNMVMRISACLDGAISVSVSSNKIQVKYRNTTCSESFLPHDVAFPHTHNG